MTRVKICGITNLEDALLAADLGAEALGFIFAPSPRRISPSKARRIISRLPPFIHKIGVFGEENPDTMEKIMEYCSLDFVQLHGEFPASHLHRLGRKAIKVFEMNKENVLDEIKKVSLPFFMLDLPKNEGERSFAEWEITDEAKKAGKFILAGGLKPENIENILERVRPFAVDVCRGVEKEKGIKSPERLKEFIFRVRKWDFLRG
ncbi:MAG: N-(5'-phosphoribosyl)anthranilate isomerase [Candidatus Aminicenantales bacterium]